MLVTDPLDVVLAEPVAEQRRALEGLDRDGERTEPFFERVPPAASVPAEPEADTNARARRSGWASTIASIALPVARR